MEYRDYCKYFGTENSDSNAAQTPAYVFDEDALRSRVESIRTIAGERVRIIYAIKANPFLVPYLKNIVDAYEICSPGEERICEKYGVPAPMMVLSGVNKQAGDFEHAFAYASRKGEGWPVCTVESLSQLEMLGRTVRSEILLRVTSGNQFGLDPEDVVKIIREREKYPNLEIIGLQLYTGTQKTRKKIIEREVQKIDDLIARIQDECGYPIREFEYGPGLPVSYFADEDPVDDADVLGHVTDCLNGMKWKGTVSLEMGRFLAAYCGSYVTRIVDIKHSRGVNYCIVDGGVHQINYYGQKMAMKYPFMQMKNGTTENLIGNGTDTAGADKAEDHYEICGSLCTVSDVIIRQVPLENPETGDILVFERTGAYSVTEGISLFLSRDLPRIYIKNGQELKLIREQILTEELNYGRTY